MASFCFDFLTGSNNSQTGSWLGIIYTACTLKLRPVKLLGLIEFPSSYFRCLTMWSLLVDVSNQNFLSTGSNDSIPEVD